MKEQLISLETATLAKEKQFQEYTSYFYTKENGLCSIDTDGEILNIYNDDLTFKDSIWDCNGDFWYNEIEDEEWIYAQSYEPIKYPAPTQSLLQKWLREKHNIHVEINFMSRTLPFHHGYFIILRGIGHELNLDNDSQGNYRPILSEIHGGYEIFNSYEEALEKGLQEALKLI